MPDLNSNRRVCVRNIHYVNCTFKKLVERSTVLDHKGIISRQRRHHRQKVKNIVLAFLKEAEGVGDGIGNRPSRGVHRVR